MQLHYNCVPECSFLTFFIGSQVRTHNLFKNYISAKTNSEYTEHLDNHSTQLTSGPTSLDIGPSWFSYWAEFVGPSLLVGRVDCKTQVLVRVAEVQKYMSTYHIEGQFHFALKLSVTCLI